MFDINDRETREIINGILEELLSVKGFRKFVKDSTEINWYNVYDDNRHDEFKLTGGATKGVVVLYDYDFVLKFPFDRDDRVDYCKLEYANYVEACRESFGEYFAQTEYYGKFCGLPVYVQEKVDINSDDNSNDICEMAYQDWLNNDYEEYVDEIEEEEREAREFFFDRVYECSSDFVFPFFATNWGERVASDVENFCWDNEINDIHSANFGYVDGRIVIVDFSGFGHSYDWSTSHCEKILCA